MANGIGVVTDIPYDDEAALCSVKLADATRCLH